MRRKRRRHSLLFSRSANPIFRSSTKCKRGAVLFRGFLDRHSPRLRQRQRRAPALRPCRGGAADPVPARLSRVLVLLEKAAGGFWTRSSGGGAGPARFQTLGPPRRRDKLK